MESRKQDIPAGFSDPSDGKQFAGRNSVAAPEKTRLSESNNLYRECLKNHAASIGGHAVDGCGEFSPSSDDTLKCDACGCHRNFHRRVPDPGDQTGNQFGCECHLKPYGKRHSPSSTPHFPSPYNLAPQMLLALSTGLGETDNPEGILVHQISNQGTRKRFRTKFTQEQKEKMHLFSEKLGWKIAKQDESSIQQFCNEIGVGKTVLKVWMHNNKHSFGKKDSNTDLNDS